MNSKFLHSTISHLLFPFTDGHASKYSSIAWLLPSHKRDHLFGFLQNPNIANDGKTSFWMTVGSQIGPTNMITCFMILTGAQSYGSSAIQCRTSTDPLIHASTTLLLPNNMKPWCVKRWTCPILTPTSRRKSTVPSVNISRCLTSGVSLFRLKIANV